MNEVLFSLGIYEGPFNTLAIKDFISRQGYEPEYGDLRYPDEEWSALWYRNKFATVGRSGISFEELRPVEWHRDDEQQFMDYWLVVMATHAPTEIKTPDGTIYYPKRNELVAFHNESCYHRLNLNMSRHEAEARIFYRNVIRKGVKNGS